MRIVSAVAERKMWLLIITITCSVLPVYLGRSQAFEKIMVKKNPLKMRGDRLSLRLRNSNNQVRVILPEAKVSPMSFKVPPDPI